MKFILSILGALLLLDILYWIAGELWLRTLPGPARALLWVHRGFILFQLLLFIGFVVTRFRGIPTPSNALTTGLAAFLYVWHMFVLPLVVVAGPALLVLGIVSWVRRKNTSAMAATPVPEELEGALSRRDFLAAAAVAVPPLVTLGFTGLALRQIQTFRTREMTLPIPGLPAPLDGLTIAHLSDFHVGQFTHGPVLKKIVERTNALRANLILITGDLIDRSLSDLPAALDVVKALDPHDGICMIEGNHDLFEGRRGFEQACRNSGIPFLTNQTLTWTLRGVPLQLLGLRWGGGGNFPHADSERGDAAIERSAAELLNQRNPDAFPLFLAHHPHAFDSAIRAGLPLTLSGHTHGGQLMWNETRGFGPLMYRYWSGLYRRKESTLVVSNGIGNWFPLRINAPAEIIHIRLIRS